MPDIDYPLTPREIYTRAAELQSKIDHIDFQLKNSSHWCTASLDTLKRLRSTHMDKYDQLLAQLPP